MNKNDTFNDGDRLESPLREAVDSVCADSIPDEVIESAVTRALQLATPSTCCEESTQPQRRSRYLTTRRWAILAACVATVLAVAVFWDNSTNSVLADVFKEVAKQTWMHATGKGPNDIDIEIWFSPKDGIVATRQGKDVVYVNVPQETIEVYENVKEGTSYLARLPIESKQKKLFASQEQRFQALFFGDPIKSLQAGSHEIASHTKKTVREGDATFIEYRLTSKAQRDAKPVVTVLRVDPQTKLPVSWKSMVGDMQIYSCRVEYPTHGPQSVYAMGVPKNVKVVDQALSDDMKPILAAWKTGRTRFDSYRAVVVESYSADHRAGGWLIYQVWRKGTKWRIERLRTPPDIKSFGNKEDVVPADADPKTWWLARGQKWEKMPLVVSDGTVEIKLNYIFAKPRRKDPNNPHFMLIESMKPERMNTFRGPSDDPQPREIGLTPNIEVYPALSGRGGWHYQTTVDPRPTSGPEGTVLVENLKRNPSESPGRPCGTRYWADPARGYAVRQVQYLKTGQAEDSKQGLVEMQQLALSPNGLWYPVVVRHVKNVHNNDGNVSDSYSRYYLDFEADIPDTMFDVNEWGPIE
ncbi:MAG: hypothetical protein JXM70_16730 [Pirellulales bacterium]|nr:hypothetical protein [Pirellulales bacterium]